MRDTGILNSVKKHVGVAIDDNYFDGDLVSYISTAIAVLRQIGAPIRASVIVEDDTTYDELGVEDDELLSMCVTYIKNKVRSMFDPPTSTQVGTAVTNTLSEMEWRILHACDMIRYTQVEGE